MEASSRLPAVLVSRLDPPAPLAHVTAWPVVVDAYLAAAVDSDHTRRVYHRHLYTAFTALGATIVAEVTGAALADCATPGVLTPTTVAVVDAIAGELLSRDHSVP